MAQVNRESTNKVLDIVKERYEKFLAIITNPGVDDSVYDIDNTKMVLAIADLRLALKLVRLG
jgi:hypothetical protein